MLNKIKTLDVVSLQLASASRYQKNLDTLLMYLKKHESKHLILVPEVFLTTYDYEHLATAAKFSMNALKFLKKEVNNQILVLTLILEDNGEFVNQAIVIYKHKIIHRQEKVKLFKLGDEDLYFRAGKKKKIKAFEIGGVKYAILICFELRFKELWKQIEGADIVLIPTRWGKARKVHLEVLSRALAIMNQCYVMVSNSSESDMASSSAIISPTSEVIMNDASKSVESTIDLREILKMHRYIVMT